MHFVSQLLTSNRIKILSGSVFFNTFCSNGSSSPVRALASVKLGNNNQPPLNRHPGGSAWWFAAIG